MPHPPPFPVSVDELDATFLSVALGERVGSFRSTRIGADRGMLGEIFVVDVETGSGRRTIVAKFSANREGALQSARRGRTNERELRFYEELLPTTPVSAPRCHGAWYDPETARFCLLQDLVDADTAVDQVEGLTVDQVRLVLRELAPMHARWFGDPELASYDWLPRLDSPGRTANLRRLATAGWGPLCDLLGDDVSQAERGLGATFPDRLVAALHSVAALPSTLIHSDLRADNLLFSPDGEAVSLVDWQGCGLGPPAFDVAYLLSSSLDVSTRRAHEADLLDEYRGLLAAAGLELSTEQLIEGYADSMHYTLAVATALPVISDQGEERASSLARAVARRAIEALRDHDRLWGDA